MKRPSLLRLSDAALLREFTARLARNNAESAELLAYLAEIDRRKLYRPAGYSSMFTYCVGHFHFSEAAAYKRIHAARLIRKFPEVYEALAEGRVHLSGLVLLVKYLRPENVGELLATTTHKSRRDIEKLIAERYPRPDVPAVIRELQVSAPTVAASEPTELAPGRVPDQAPSANGDESAAASPVTPSPQPETVQLVAPSPSSPDRPVVKPLSAKSYAVQFTMDEAMHELLRRAQELLGHRVAPGDIAAVFGRALKAYVGLLERSKFAATSTPKALCKRPGKDSRHIPARVQRAVWERDGGQCTYVSESGHRCDERSALEFDHVLEYARGGEATVDGIRLRCRTHNQFEAERTYGVEFMRHKREQAIAARAALRGRGGQRTEEELSPGRVFDIGVSSTAEG